MVIEVPDGKPHMGPQDGPIPTFTIPGLHHRPLVEVIKSVWSDPSSRFFHFTPFKLMWQCASGVLERLYGELYYSNSYIEANDRL